MRYVQLLLLAIVFSFCTFLLSSMVIQAEGVKPPLDYTVKYGDTLWGISKEYFGSGFLWKYILSSNQSIGFLLNGSQALIRPGQVLILDEKYIVNGTDQNKNIALNKPIIQEQGQVVYKDYATIYSSKNMTDGDTSKGWRTVTDANNNKDNTMAVIDLQGEYLINKVSFIAQFDTKPEFDREILFKVDYSNSEKVDMLKESDWTELGSTPVSVEEVRKTHDLIFSPIKARFIRVQYVHEDEEWGGWGNIQEVMVYGV